MLKVHIELLSLKFSISTAVYIGKQIIESQGLRHSYVTTIDIIKAIGSAVLTHFRYE